MGLGKQGDRQNRMWISCDEMPQSKGLSMTVFSPSCVSTVSIAS